MTNGWLTLFALLCGLTLPHHASAQDTPPAPAPAPAPARATVGRAAGAAPPNVRFDIAINDTGVTTPINKVVTLNVSQGGNGSIRSSVRIPGAPVPAPRTVTTQGADGKPLTTTTPSPIPTLSLNVDVGQLTIYEDGKIRAFIVIDYQPYQPASATRAEPAVVRANSVSVFESGKKMMLLQAADPMSDRRTTIEVTATVLN
jgi:hypothetical protein